MKNLNLKTNVKNMKGITLVSLVITIIILLILATVSLSLIINNGILDKAKYAVDKYSEGEIGEQIKLAYLEWQTVQLTGTTESASDFIKNRLNASIGNVEEVSIDESALIVTINKENEEKTYYYNIKSGTVKQIVELAKNSTNKNDSYVGCYADIDEDGTVDGIIFADLLTGSVRDAQAWGTNGNGAYTLPTNVTDSNVKSYYISQACYKDSNFDKNPVISPIKSNKEDRFYVMSLSNFSTPAYTDENDSSKNYPAYTSYSWYKKVNGKMSPLITSNNFGEGKENTRKMIAKWNAAKTANGYDAEQDNQDIWKHIQTKYAEGWFLPSGAEWAAFANEIGGDTPITTSNYNTTYGLSSCYLSSSQNNSNRCLCAYFNVGWIGHNDANVPRSVCLATTF